jgi:putative drug exporter of the RND superfamily
MFDRLGRGIARHPKKTLLAWLLAALLLAVVAPRWDERCQDDDIRFLPARCLSMQGYQLLREAFPREVSGSKAIFAFERTNEPLSEADLDLVHSSSTALEKLRRAEPELQLGAITCYRDPVMGSRLLSADRCCTLLLVSLDTPFLAHRTSDTVRKLEETLQPLLAAYSQSDEHAATQFRMVTTGTSGMGRDLNEAAFQSIEDTTLATLILVIVILLAVYRAPLLALVPLATIGASVWISLRLLALVTLLPGVHLVNITRVFVVVVLFGAGTDYCLFLISRYREEMQRGLDPVEAVRAGLARVGWALTASAGTVVCGLGMMGFAEFAKLRYAGPAIALSLVVALLASLTLAPALLCILGRRAFWPRGVAAVAEGREPSATRLLAGRFWTWLSGHVAAHPGRIWVGTVLALLPLAVLGVFTTSTNNISSELPRRSQGREGLALISRHFNPGEIGPLIVLLLGQEDWRLPAGQQCIRELTDQLSAIENIAEVRSLTQPLGTAPTKPGEGQSTTANLTGLLFGTLISDRYVAHTDSGQVTRLEIVFHSEPFAQESHVAMEAVRDCLDHFVRTMRSPLAPRFTMFGITTVSSDVTALQESDRTLVNGLVLASIFLILATLVRRPLVAVYLLVSVLFSYFVAIGAAELLAIGWLESDVGAIDWKVPFFLFTILVAIGEDYNIFLMTRVLEESRRHGMRQGIQRALARTGGTISACGLIMAGTFGTLMLGQLPTLVQLGLALTVGVLLDTFVVRPILVPAFLLMLDGWRQRGRVPQRAAIPVRGPHFHLPIVATEDPESPCEDAARPQHEPASASLVE